MAAGLHRREESGRLSMENDEGSASSTAAESFEFATCVANSMPTARGDNHRPKIPDTADKIKVLYAVKSNLEELRRGAGLNQLQIAHHPHPPTSEEAARVGTPYPIIVNIILINKINRW
jgi:hypothetical protein